MKWVYAFLLINMAVYLVVLSPLRPVKNVRKIQEFTQLMEKLKSIVSKSLSKTIPYLTYYK